MAKPVVLAAVLLLCACKKTNSDATTGSGSGSGRGSAAVAAADAATAKGKSLAELMSRYQECWGFFSAGDYDQLETCYAPEAVSDAPGIPGDTKGAHAIASGAGDQKAGIPDSKGELELVLVSGHTIVGIALFSGTNTEPMPTAEGNLPASGKRVGYYFGHVADLDEEGRIAHESAYFDAATILGQIAKAPKAPVRQAPAHGWTAQLMVIAKGNDKEKANVATIQSFIAAINKHDAAAAGALVADDVVWSEQPEPADYGKKDLLATMNGMFGGFPDLKFDVTRTIAAGDWVAITATVDGTNTGDLPPLTKKTGKKLALPVLEAYKIENGKITQAWVFFQSLAFKQQLGLK